MTDASNIREPMEVIGADDKHVGRVDHVVGTDIELAKLDIAGGFKHHMIPLSWVDYVEDDKVKLSLTADGAKAAWRETH
jgi:hypothetical protein